MIANSNPRSKISKKIPNPNFLPKISKISRKSQSQILNFQEKSLILIPDSRFSEKIPYPNSGPQIFKIYLKSQSLIPVLTNLSQMSILDPVFFEKQIPNPDYGSQIFKINPKSQSVIWDPISQIPIPGAGNLGKSVEL